MDAMLIILPLFCFIITLPTACVNKKVPFKLMSITAVQSSSENSSTKFLRLIPAVFTKISILPKIFTVFSITCSICSFLLTSALKHRACWFVLLVNLATFCSKGSLLLTKTKFAPASDNANAIPLPKPLLAPVTIATLLHLKKPPSLKVVMGKRFYHKNRYIC